MTNEDFKMDYYFQKYKEYTMISLEYFRKEFKKTEGNYDKIDELFRKIQRHQIAKYGNVVGTGGHIFVENRRVTKNDGRKIKRRFGTKAERRARRKEHYIESKGE